ncbi:MAG: DUF983 domain-containing protein [Acidimicrobiia bacterium]
MSNGPPTRFRLLGRALRRRCPRCGQARLFRRWITMVLDCPRCGHHFEREQGYWLGAVTVNTAITFGLFIVLGISIMALTWPEVPWSGLLIVTLVFNGLFPVWFYPFSKTIWVALDLAVRPTEPGHIQTSGQRTAGTLP